MFIRSEYVLSRSASALAVLVVMLIARDAMASSWVVAAPLIVLLLLELGLWCLALVRGGKHDQP